MGHKGFLPLFVLFLGFSFLLYSVAIPASRSFKPFDYPSAQESLAQGEMEMRTNRGLSDVDEGLLMEGRMDLEVTDYPGTGPNPGHDPKPPGRA